MLDFINEEKQINFPTQKQKDEQIEFETSYQKTTEGSCYCHWEYCFFSSSHWSPLHASLARSN